MGQIAKQKKSLETESEEICWKLMKTSFFFSDSEGAAHKTVADSAMLLVGQEKSYVPKPSFSLSLIASRGKTVLCWRYAYSVAERGFNVIFFCMKQKLEKSGVRACLAVLSNPNTLKRIKIV